MSHPPEVVPPFDSMTEKCSPFVNYTANDAAEYGDNVMNGQIYELRQSLGYITHTMPAQVNTTRGKENNEPGNKLLECYQGKGAGTR